MIAPLPKISFTSDNPLFRINLAVHLTAEVVLMVVMHLSSDNGADGIDPYVGVSIEVSAYELA